MPQLEFADYAPQIVWLAISFIILYLVMSRIALPRVASVLDERERQVQSDIERAEKLKAEADESLAAYERTMAEARATAQGELRKAAETIAAEASAREGSLGAKLAEQSAAAERSIAAAKQSALAELQSVAGEIAGTIAGKLAGVQASGGEVQAAVAEVMKERH